MKTASPIDVLFVCLGNICRSPAAEGVLRMQLELQLPGTSYVIASTGTNGYHIGDLPDRRMRQAASKRGYDLRTRSSLLTPEMARQAKRIIAMDDQNVREIRRIAGRDTQVQLLSEFLDSNWPREVPDPYYGDEDGFEAVLDMLEAACPKIIRALQDLEPL